MTYEEKMKRIEEIIEELNGEVPLEKAMDLYREGGVLIAECGEYLGSAEKLLQPKES